MNHNLVCVHWGQAYSADYVLNLWQAARRHSGRGFNFHVFTDQAQQHPQDLGWKFHILQHRTISGMRPWWYKMEIFNAQQGLNGKNLYLDLDVVIVNDIDKFWEYQPNDFCICHDFNRAFNPKFPYSNSSVMFWPDHSQQDLYQQFIENPVRIVRKYRGDQDFIHDQCGSKLQWWPRQWAMSWKWEVYRGGKTSPHGSYLSDQQLVLDPDTSVIVFHGSPKPHQVADVSTLWKNR